MSEWENRKLGDILTLNYGKGLKTESRRKGLIPVYSSAGLTGYHSESLVNTNGIILGRKGSIGTVYLSESPFWCIDTAYYILPDEEKYNLEFIFYFLKTLGLDDLNEDSAVPGLNRNTFYSLDIKLPSSFDEQKAIASVLSSLDNKIDLLHRQNKTLESMAETLFRQWFSNDVLENKFIKKRLDDVAIIQNGYAFSSKDYISSTGNDLEVLKMGHIEKDGGLKLNPKKDFVSRVVKLEKWILSKNDIVMAMTDMKDNVVILGVPALIDTDNKYVLNQRVARITLKNNNDFIHPILLYLQLKDKDFILNLQSQANSGVQVNLSTQTIRDAEIYVPDIGKQKALGENIINLYLRIDLIRNQIRLLETLRDTLLPKLMSGEVRVSYQ